MGATVACDGATHAAGTGGHDGGPAVWAVRYQCDCGAGGVIHLCDGRYREVVGGDGIQCAACDRISRVGDYWVAAARIGAVAAESGRVEPRARSRRASASEGGRAVPAADLVEEWAADLRARACRPKSVATMTSTLRTFAAQLSPTPLEAVSRAQIVDWLGTEGWSPLTRRTYRTTISTFYDWMTVVERIPVNPAARLPRTRVPYSEPNPLTTVQVQTLLDGGCRRRTRMMILLAAYQGLRASEIARVHGRDIEAGLLHIPEGKGGTSLYRPLHPLIADLARSFPQDGYWFPGNRGNAHVDGRSVSSTIAHAMKRAGIVGHRPHQLRAWHATELVRAKVDAVTVQHSMRHATLGTLHKYVRADAADVASALERLPVLTATV